MIELLMVIAILGLLAALVVPAIKNLGKSNVTVSATRQLLDDIGRARQLAIANRTTVYMVFVPTNFWGTWTNSLTPAQFSNDLISVIDKQLTGYTFMSHGRVGDQPGQHQWHYLSTWRSLPDGTFVASQKFAPMTNYIPNWVGNITNVVYTILPFNYTNIFPFPTEDSGNVPLGPHLPYIAFNYLGQLTDDGVNMANNSEFIPLERGSVAFPIDPATKIPILPSSPMKAGDISEVPFGNNTNSAYNVIEIDPLTGRPTLHFQKLP